MEVCTCSVQIELFPALLFVCIHNSKNKESLTNFFKYPTIAVHLNMSVNTYDAFDNVNICKILRNYQMHIINFFAVIIGCKKFIKVV